MSPHRPKEGKPGRQELCENSRQRWVADGAFRHDSESDLKIRIGWPGAMGDGGDGRDASEAESEWLPQSRRIRGLTASG